jgi:hypothetical protein
MNAQQAWPWRMLVVGTFEDAWMTGTRQEREQAYERWIALHRAWQSQGARLICTMDDLGSAGRPGTERGNFYTVWEIPNPDIAHTLLEPMWGQAGQTPLTAHFSIRVSIGKPIISMERDLGGPQQATIATAEGEMPAIPHEGTDG